MLICWGLRITGNEFVEVLGARQLEESPAYTLPDCNLHNMREKAGIEPTVRMRHGVITMIFELRDCNAVVVCPRIEHSQLLRGGFLLLMPNNGHSSDE